MSINVKFFFKQLSHKKINEWIAQILLSLYISIIMLFYFCSFQIELLSILGIIITSFFISHFIIIFIQRFIERKCYLSLLPCTITNSKDCTRKKFYLIVTSITFILMFILFIKYFPGKTSPDTINQKSQALGEIPYNDWHPILHTVLFYTLPLKLFRGWEAAIILFQIIWFSFAFGYLILVLSDNIIPIPWCKVFCLFFWCYNFAFCHYVMYPWKDIAMSIFAMVLMAYYIRIVTTEGKWFNNLRNVFLFTLFSILCIYMRHNAVLFVAPLIILALFYTKKKWLIRGLVLLCCVIGYILIQILYGCMNVEKPGLRKVETMGLPLTICSAASSKKSNYRRIQLR